MLVSPPLTTLSSDQLCERGAQYAAMAGTARSPTIQASLERLAGLYTTMAAERAVKEQEGTMTRD